LFAPRDNTPAALEYDAAGPSQRDALIASRVNSSWLWHIITQMTTPYIFNCNNYMIGGVISSIRSLGTDLIFEEWSNKDFKLFDWYFGTKHDSIAYHGGSFNGC